MLVTTQNSELVNKLLTLADGDIDLVQKAIRTMSEDGKAADLERVVNFIVNERNVRAARAKAVA